MRFRPSCTLAALLFILSTEFVGYDPCETICKGYDLWEQSNVSGECIESRMIEKNSIECLNPLEKEEYAVYNVVLEAGLQYFETSHPSFQPIEIVVIEGDADLESMRSLVMKCEQTQKYMRREMPALERETFEDFEMKNTEPYPLHNFFDLSVPVILLSREELDELFESGDWDDKFYMRYNSKAFVTVSRVGFNAEMDQALVYGGLTTITHFGVGYYVLLSKEWRCWKIQKVILAYDFVMPEKRKNGAMQQDAVIKMG